MNRRSRRLVTVGLVFAAVMVFGLAAMSLFARNLKPCTVLRMEACVGPNGTLSQGIRMYHYDMGMWPEKMEDLITPPSDPTLRTKWTAYIEDRSDLKDPWGRDVRYRSGAKAIHNPGQFDLWSVGPDGVDGTEDDICNWKLDSKR